MFFVPLFSPLPGPGYPDYDTGGGIGFIVGLILLALLVWWIITLV